MGPQERFAVNLKQLRHERSWSQEDLSRHSGMHTTTISKFENCERAPKFETIVRLAEAFEVTAGQLLEGIP